MTLTWALIAIVAGVLIALLGALSSVTCKTHRRRRPE